MLCSHLVISQHQPAKRLGAVHADYVSCVRTHPAQSPPRESRGIRRTEDTDGTCRVAAHPMPNGRTLGRHIGVWIAGFGHLNKNWLSRGAENGWWARIPPEHFFAQFTLHYVQNKNTSLFSLRIPDEICYLMWRHQTIGLRSPTEVLLSNKLACHVRNGAWKFGV